MKSYRMVQEMAYMGGDQVEGTVQPAPDQQEHATVNAIHTQPREYYVEEDEVLQTVRVLSA